MPVPQIPDKLLKWRKEKMQKKKDEEIQMDVFKGIVITLLILIIAIMVFQQSPIEINIPRPFWTQPVIQPEIICNCNYKVTCEYQKPKEKFGITCVYSVDNPFSNVDACDIDTSAGLRCGGYGSAVVVTTSFAMVAVAEVLKKLSKAQ